MYAEHQTFCHEDRIRVNKQYCFYEFLMFEGSRIYCEAGRWSDAIDI